MAPSRTPGPIKGDPVSPSDSVTSTPVITNGQHRSPAPVGSRSDKAIQNLMGRGFNAANSIEANTADYEYGAPVYETEFERKWLKGKVEFSIAVKQEKENSHVHLENGGKIKKTIKIKGTGYAPIVSKFKDAAVASEWEFIEGLSLTLETNATKSEANAQKIEKFATAVKSKIPKNRLKKSQRKAKKFELSDMLPVFAFGVKGKAGPDFLDGHKEFLRQIGLPSVLKKAGLTLDSDAVTESGKNPNQPAGMIPEIEIKAEVSEYPLVVQLSLPCKLRTPSDDPGMSGLKVSVKIKIAVMPALGFFERVATHLSEAGRRLLVRMFLSNPKLLEKVAAYAARGMRFVGRANIVLGFLIGLWDIGRLVYHVHKWLELEEESEQRRIAVAATMDEHMAKIGCELYAIEYAQFVFPTDLKAEYSRTKEAYQMASYMAAAGDVDDDKAHKQNNEYLIVVRKAIADAKKAARTLIQEEQIPAEILNYRPRSMMQRLNKELLIDEIYRRIFAYIVQRRFSTAKDLADHVERIERRRLAQRQPLVAR